MAKICTWVVVVAACVLAYGVIKSSTLIENQVSNTYVLLWNKLATTGKIERKDRIGEVIEKLIACESGGDPNALHPHDGKDGKDSKGILQFKLATFIDYAKTLKVFPEAEAAELPNLWDDPTAQIMVAEKMLKEPTNLRHWENCAIEHNLYEILGQE